MKPGLDQTHFSKAHKRQGGSWKFEFWQYRRVKIQVGKKVMIENLLTLPHA